MIYLITEKKDLMSDLVIEYLLAASASFTRYDDDTFVPETTALDNTGESSTAFHDARKVWNRRGALSLLPAALRGDYPGRTACVRYLHREAEIVNLYQERRLKDRLGADFIGSYAGEVHNNKLVNLQLAKASGLQIPPTLVTTNKSDLQAFCDQHERVITKDLRAPVRISTETTQLLSTGVQIVTPELIEPLADHFAPVLLQAYVPKVYEIRLFVVGDKHYPMAIFSQNDTQTAIDYRNYNRRRPNRCVPVHLPEPVTEAVRSFMVAAELNTGSLDLIYTPSGEYYFLEINPMGQFHWLSENCNYRIEAELAQLLSRPAHGTAR